MCISVDLVEKWATSHRVVPAGREIYAEGEECDSLFLVRNGWAIQHQILEDGRRQILSFALPNSLLGFQADSVPAMSHSAECLTDVTVAVIPKSKLPELFRRDPNLAVGFALLAAETLNCAFETLTDVGRRTAREAVAHLLLRLFLRMRAIDPSAPFGAVDFPLTLEHIGDALGLTGVHVCRTLKSLREDGVVHLTRGTLRIGDLERLVEAAGCSYDNIPYPDGYVAPAPRRPGQRNQGPAAPRQSFEDMRLAS